jgi:DNA polymerase III subunit beta
MICIVEQSTLTKTLGKLQGILSKKSSRPILSYYLINAVDNELVISGTDLEVSISMRVEASIQEAGDFCVPGKMFSEVVRQLPDGPITFSLSDRARLEIKSKKAKFKLNVLSATEFPPISGLDLKVSQKVNVPVLLEMINKTIYAVSNDDTRFNLSGVCLEGVTGGGVRLVATDGHRLAMITRDAPEFNVSKQYVIPRRGLSEFRKILEDINASEVGVELSENGFILFESRDSKVALRLMDTEFPDYKSAFPRGQAQIVKINCQEFTEALRRVLLMVSVQGKSVRFDIESNHIKISSATPELGESEETISAEFFGDACALGFNARFLLDVATCFASASTIVLEIVDNVDAARFYPEGDDSALAIVMPMRIE